MDYYFFQEFVVISSKIINFLYFLFYYSLDLRGLFGDSVDVIIVVEKYSSKSFFYLIYYVKLYHYWSLAIVFGYLLVSWFIQFHLIDWMCYALKCLSFLKFSISDFGCSFLKIS